MWRDFIFFFVGRNSDFLPLFHHFFFVLLNIQPCAGHFCFALRPTIMGKI